MYYPTMITEMVIEHEVGVLAGTVDIHVSIKHILCTYVHTYYNGIILSRELLICTGLKWSVILLYAAL